MGFEVNRFEGEVDEELLCPICSAVLEDPVQAPSCEHAFCSHCINEWLTRQQTCPVDRGAITPNQLKAPPRILRNLLSRLDIACDHASYGCTSIVKLDMLQSHLQECEFNPKRPVLCSEGCGLIVPKDELKQHNCVKELHGLVQVQQMKISKLQTEIIDLRIQNTECKREIQLVKEYMRSMRSPVPPSPRIREGTSDEQDEILRWASSLSAARVSRWGGMISTPDAVLQAVIKRALNDSVCPPYIVNDLMENAHERKWPPGLSSLETRQLNRRQYENYVTKRIPGKQAVVVMACENTHMSEDMIIEPGLVMIFAHGIE